MKLEAYAEVEEVSPRPGDDEARWLACEVVARRFEESRQRLKAQSEGFFNAVREVVVVASSSRSGSSLLAELLSRSSKFLHFPGEINPLLRLASLAWPESGASDSLSPEQCTGQAVCDLEDHFAMEVGRPAAAREQSLLDGEFEEEFDENLFRRLCLQWPLETFMREEVSAARAEALAEVRQLRGRPCEWEADLQLFHALFLKEICGDHPAVKPYYYDLDRTLVRDIFPDLCLTSGPPSPVIVEEPPFILVRPWVRWQPANLLNHPVIIKTPSNAFRLGFLRALFPNARFRLLHLTRNPAASINGIYDGWRHWGFHSHYVGAQLDVAGYSDARPGDRGWWKFDLPPGWQEYTRSPLEQICGFQWSSAQSSILEFARSSGVDYHRIRFEDILRDNESRLRIYRDFCRWMGDADEELLDALSRPLSPVMATAAPRQRRWQEKAEMLRRIINHSTIRSLSDALGYGDEAEWI